MIHGGKRGFDFNPLDPQEVNQRLVLRLETMAVGWELGVSEGHMGGDLNETH
jgi:hypothetical protein